VAKASAKYLKSIALSSAVAKASAKYLKSIAFISSALSSKSSVVTGTITPAFFAVS